MGDEVALFDTGSGAVHIINETGGMIWELCDGSNTLSDIEERLLVNYDVPEGTDLRKDIESCLGAFREHGVLTIP